MLKYYAHINTLNNSISKGQCPCISENIECVEITEDIYNNIEKYIVGKKEIEVIIPDFETKEVKTPYTEEVTNESGEVELVEKIRIELQEIQVGEHTETKIIPYPILNPNYDKEQKLKELEQFKKDFFETSLGWVRRTVTMQNGVQRDFLFDILPNLEAGVPIITYNLDGTQNRDVFVTSDFIAQCKQQILKDFYGG